MYKINLHAHTHNSDGAHSVLEMAHQAKELGHCCLVVTDHDYLEGFYSSMAEARTLKENGLLPLPVIVGSEIETPMGEFLLFGTESIKTYLKNRELFKRLFEADMDIWWQTFISFLSRRRQAMYGGGVFKLQRVGTSIWDNLDYALVMCHPHPSTYECKHGWPDGFDIIHGVENTAGGYMIEEEWIHGLTKALKAVPVKTSDAHEKSWLGKECMEIETEITTEKQLITWLRDEKKKIVEKGKIDENTSI